MRVISLVDNCASPLHRDLRTEPGLSIHIEANDMRILFDTGVKDAFLANAERLGVNISSVNLAVLSHHHYDHGGGLDVFMSVNSSAGVYLCGGGTADLTLRVLKIFTRRVGLDKSTFACHPDRSRYIDTFTEIAAGVFILTNISTRHPTPKGNRNLYDEQQRPAVRDDFSHELVLVIAEGRKLHVFTGCSHHGILNVLDAVLDRFPGRPIDTLIGGFHLIEPGIIDTMAGTRKEVEELGRALLRYPLGMVYTGHCTGKRAFRILKEVMGEKLEYLACGDRLEV